MGKLRLSVHRKNEVCKKYNCFYVVSILKVSIPLLFSASPAATLPILQKRIHDLQVLPQSTPLLIHAHNTFSVTLIYYICITDASRQDKLCRLVLCRVVFSQLRKTEQISFSIQIHDDFSWSLLLYQQHIDHSTPKVLGMFSQHLNSAKDVGLVAHALEATIICQGNPDEKFSILASYKKGVFKDQIGNIHVILYMHID